MRSNLIVVSKDKQITKNWSGGSTTELFIHPQSATLEKQNFTFRISTAHVETEQSTFTSFPGFERLLMILKGKLEITHKDYYSKTVKPFDVDAFQGDWETTSTGQATDFNLIFRKAKYATLTAEELKAGSLKTIETNASFCFGYILNGSCNLINDDTTSLGEGDLFVAKDLETALIEVITNCTLILGTVELK